MSVKKAKVSFPFYVDEYLADTNRFTAHQHGIYLLLLLEYWREDGKLSANADELCEIAKIDRRTYNKLIPTVLKKFELEENMLRHKGLDQELQKHKTLQEKRREGGKLSAQRRWGNKSADQQARESVTSGG